MPGRYTKFYSLPSRLYLKGAPVMIEAGRLLLDNQLNCVVGQIRLVNLGEALITGATVCFTPTEPAGEPFTHRFSGFSIGRDALCARNDAVPFPDQNVQSFTAAVTRVDFSDGNVWTAPKDAEWVPMPETEKRVSFGDPYAEKMYKEQLTGADKYKAWQDRDLWCCGCGALNRAEESFCHKCGKAYADFMHTEEEFMQQGKYAAAEALLTSGKKDDILLAGQLFTELGAYKDAAEKAARAAEMSLSARARRQAKKTAEEPRPAAGPAQDRNCQAAQTSDIPRAVQKKKGKPGLVILLALLVLGALAYVFIIKDMLAYKDAKELLEAGQLEEAKAAFGELGEYKDCAEQIMECDYRKAKALFAEDRFEEAMAGFEALGTYSDSEAQAENCMEAIRDRDYTAAAALLEDGKPEQARAAFIALGSYRDSADMVNECDYRTAAALLKDGKYEEAEAAFSALGAYKDSSAQIVRCKAAMRNRDYGAALTLLEEGKIEEAREIFVSLGKYSDSMQMVKECDYRTACTLLEAGQTEEAMAIFLTLTGYSDTEEMLRECDYRIAGTFFDAENYEEALSLYASLGEYKDSAERAEECMEKKREIDYAAARELYRQCKYEEAAAAFRALGDYQNSVAMADLCDYYYAMNLLNTGRIAEAKEIFVSLGDYSDSALMVRECDYRLAQSLLDRGRYDKAFELFAGIRGYKDVDDILSKNRDLRAAAGDVILVPGAHVFLGTYPQTEAGNDKTPIEWQVLAREENRALLISVCGLDMQPYHTKEQDITWEMCSLRRWLNNDFMRIAFARQDQSLILTTDVDNSVSQGRYSTGGGRNTRDRVFLLSYTEAQTYFNSDEERVRQVTDYAVSKGAYEVDATGAGWWWLRSPSISKQGVLVVNGKGTLGSQHSVRGLNYTVCPVMWVDVGSEFWAEYEFSKPEQAHQTPEEPETEPDQPQPTDIDSLWSVGNYVTFGTYPQTSGGQDRTPIDWLVLRRQDSKVLIISKYGLDTQLYDNTKSETSWKSSYLRVWLNRDFMREAFSETEQQAIRLTKLDNADDMNAREDWSSEDRVFLLSYKEAQELFPDPMDMICSPTDYAAQNGAAIGVRSKEKGLPPGGWWLRIRGYVNHAEYIGANAARYYRGIWEREKGICVRPVVWVDLDVIRALAGEE